MLNIFNGKDELRNNLNRVWACVVLFALLSVMFPTPMAALIVAGMTILLVVGILAFFVKLWGITL